MMSYKTEMRLSLAGIGLNFSQILQILCHRGFYTNAKNVPLKSKIWVQLRKDILRKTKQELTWRSDAKANGKKIKKDGGCISFAPEKSSKSSKSSKSGPKSTYCQELRKTGEIRGQGTIHKSKSTFAFFDSIFFDFYSSQTAN